MKRAIAWLTLIAISILSLGVALPAKAQTGEIERIHDPCIIEENATYYIFSTGPGVLIHTSADLVTWKYSGRVFETMPAWAHDAVPAARSMWAPDISFFNGAYHLYYAVSRFGTNDSCVGLATNKTLNPASKDYQWIDQGKVISSTPKQDNWNAIDPNVIIDEQNQPWLALGSYWSGIKLCKLDAETGKPSKTDSKLYALADRHGGPIEGAFIIRKSDYFFLFVSFDHCCQGVNSDYKIMVGRSKNVTGPYVDRDGKAMTDGGGTLVLASYGHVRGPGHNAVLMEKDGDWLVHHYYDADASGLAKLQIRPLLWADDGWPLPGEPVPYGDAVKNISMAGQWQYSVDDGKPKTITLLNNGHIDSVDGAATWTLHDVSLELHWPTADGSGGASSESCAISRDGRWFVGRTQRGEIIRGVRAEPGK